MIPLTNSRRVRYGDKGEHIVEDFEGYYLTVEEIITLCRDFDADQRDGFVSNDKTWIEMKLKEL